MSPRARLIFQLQRACSGELAAAHAYRGHGRSVRDAAERADIRRIEDEEWHHRQLLKEMLNALGAHPLPVLEVVMGGIGRFLGLMCHLSGWFMPMYGAGRLESHNVQEYVDAARYARESGHLEWVDCLLAMAEVEWDHERYFRAKVVDHPVTRVIGLWPAPPSRERIRG